MVPPKDAAASRKRKLQAMYKMPEIKPIPMQNIPHAADGQQRQPKTTPITDDYEISNTVLGLGINGKVVQCTNRKTGAKYALKVGGTFRSGLDHAT